MTYSCAIFEDLDGDLKAGVDHTEWSGGKGLQRLANVTSQTAKQETTPLLNSDNAVEPTKDELYDAQMRKLHHVLKKAKIRPGHRVLEIGSGWGSMAILIASTIPDTYIDTLTLSSQQQQLAQERIKAAGLEDRITVHLMDYRDMPPHWEHRFDRVISIEMIEAVGAEFMQRYWQQVDWAMKIYNGVGVVQVITIPEARECVSTGSMSHERVLNSSGQQGMKGTSVKSTLFANGCVSTFLLAKHSSTLTITLVSVIHRVSDDFSVEAAILSD